MSQGLRTAGLLQPHALVGYRRQHIRLSPFSFLASSTITRATSCRTSTIKFIETARHPPSRATLLRLISVEELKLTWGDSPGACSPPTAERPLVVQGPQYHSELNCLVTPSFDPVRMIMELGRFLNGAGGHVEQTGELRRQGILV